VEHCLDVIVEQGHEMIVDKPDRQTKHNSMSLRKPGNLYETNERSPRPFLQPLAVALISLVLVSLALVTGLMDLRTLDKTLTGYIEKRGLDIIKNIQQAAKYNFHLLAHGTEADMGGLAGSGLVEETFSLREAMMLDLMGLAQQIDFEREQGRLNHTGLSALADEHGIWLLALVDERGNIVYQNRPVSDMLLEDAAKVIAGKEGISVDVFGPRGEGDETGTFAIRRKWGNGAILLGLTREDVDFWMARVSIEQAVTRVGLGTEGRYLVVTDAKGRTLFQTDGSPICADSADPASARTQDGILNLMASLRLNGYPPLQAWLGLSRETADLMIEKERRRGFAFIGFMVCIAILSMGFLYRSQAKHVAQTREMERRLHQAERLSAMGRLAAGVAHEIRNPLNAMSMACQRLQKDNLAQMGRVIRDEIARLNHIVEEFTTFSRNQRPVLKEHDMVALVRHMAALVEEEASTRGITLSTDLPHAPLKIWMDADKIRQALFNIVKNAMESIPGRGAIAIALSREGKRRLTIRVSDTGTGLGPEEIQRIFNPDYTTKEQGLGLGLALAHEIVAAHGGEIRVMSEPGKGSIFEVVLPFEAPGGRGYGRMKSKGE